MTLHTTKSCNTAPLKIRTVGTSPYHTGVALEIHAGASPEDGSLGQWAVAWTWTKSGKYRMELCGTHFEVK